MNVLNNGIYCIRLVVVMFQISLRLWIAQFRTKEPGLGKTEIRKIRNCRILNNLPISYLRE